VSKQISLKIQTSKTRARLLLAKILQETQTEIYHNKLCLFKMTQKPENFLKAKKFQNCEKTKKWKTCFKPNF